MNVKVTCVVKVISMVMLGRVASMGANSTWTSRPIGGAKLMFSWSYDIMVVLAYMMCGWFKWIFKTSSMSTLYVLIFSYVLKVFMHFSVLSAFFVQPHFSLYIMSIGFIYVVFSPFLKKSWTSYLQDIVVVPQ